MTLRFGLLSRLNPYLVKMKIFFSLAFAALMFAACSSSKKDTLIYISKENGVSQFYKMQVGQSPALLLPDNRKIANPVLSPNREMLAFMSEDSGNWNIHIYNMVTNKEVRASNGPSIESFTSWSPDGSMIAYMSNRANNRDIYVSTPDGQNETRVTDAASIESEPLWSPSVKNRLYYKSLRNGYEGVYMQEIGSDQIGEIAPVGGANDMLRAVPGMPEVSFVHRSARQSNFLVYDEKDQTAYSLLATPKTISGYAWSPDARRLAISISGQVEIYAYSTDLGLQLEKVIALAAYPAWSPDSQRLYYNKRIDGILQVFRYSLDDQSEHQITFGASDCTEATVY